MFELRPDNCLPEKMLQGLRYKAEALIRSFLVITSSGRIIIIFIGNFREDQREKVKMWKKSS